MNTRVPIIVLLSLAVAAVYHQAWSFSFVSFDDLQLIQKNLLVRAGLTWRGLNWAFVSAWQENIFFYPLSLVSHMLDCQVYGLNPAGHHLSSVLFHAAAVVFFFLFLERLTGAFWRSALAAGFFAIHPLGAESVAWVAERSNVLCAALMALSLYAYSGYAQNRRKNWFGISLVAFVLALLAKPTAVMMPVILVLLDWLVLSGSVGQTGKRSMALAIVDKIPFFVFSGLRLWAVLLAGRGTSPVLESDSISFGLLLANGVVSLVKYLWQIVYPANLSVYYPFPDSIPWWQPAGALLLILLITAWAARHRRDAPMLLLGWLWYLVFLVPSFGVVRSGPWPAMADHYVYIPLLGIFMSAIWAVPGRLLRTRPGRILIPAAGVVLLLIWGTAAFLHTLHFKNSRALFTQAVSVTFDNFFAHVGLGNACLEEGEYDKAEKQFRRALAIKPDSAGAQANLALVLDRLGRTEAARSHFLAALQLSPESIPAHLGLANLYQKTGQVNQAKYHYRTVLALDPENIAANYNLGRLLLQEGEPAAAAECFSRALAGRPDDQQIARALQAALALTKSQ